MRRKFVVSQSLVVLIIVLLVAGCKYGSSSYSTPTGPGTPPPASTAPNTVNIARSGFGPSTMTVAKNTSVTWVNKDNIAHTATADDGTWDTGSIAPGASKAITFANAGTIAYHCTVHPMMTAKLVVQ